MAYYSGGSMRNEEKAFFILIAIALGFLVFMSCGGQENLAKDEICVKGFVFKGPKKILIFDKDGISPKLCP
jgi:hypothetical protein